MEARPHYLFFALRPDAEAARRIAALAGAFRRRHGLAGRLVAPSRLHISLNFVAKLARPDPQVIDRALAAGEKALMPAFTVALDRVGGWGRGVGDKPVVLWSDDGVLGVRLLHEKIHARLAEMGLAPRAEPNIEPHLTVMRAAGEAPVEFVAPVNWTVEEFVLLDSVRGEGRHEVLGRWRLGC